MGSIPHALETAERGLSSKGEWLKRWTRKYSGVADENAKLLQRDAVKPTRRIWRDRIGKEDGVGVCEVGGDGRPIREIGRSEDHVGKSLRPGKLKRESVGTESGGSHGRQSNRCDVEHC